MFDTVLIANRGEIACRVIRTCDRLGIATVAVYSDADADARHVGLATTATRIGPADARESYLSVPAIIDAAKRTGAQAIHPGYGFLAENPELARACEEAGIAFVGPREHALVTMGDKIRARAAVEARDVPTVPGLARPDLTDDELAAAADDIGFPVLIKPSAGGGGKGMHRVDDPAGLRPALARARREAGAAFGDDTLFLERFVTNPRHIEVQVLADAHGSVIHLGERECSLQRRHQKVVEEAPSPLLTPEQRASIGQAAVETARAVDYVGAGTVEFIVSGDRPDEPFFMEMNTRLQVEHPVTELVTGLDLVELQLRVAAGEPLPLTQDDVHLTGHAIEARLYAEDPAAGFLPTGGQVLSYGEPAGPGVRVDSSLVEGAHIATRYDPMLAKVIAHGRDRAEALTRLDAALVHTRVHGVVTNLPFLRALLHDDAVRAGNLDTGLIDRGAEALAARPVHDRVHALAGLVLWAQSFAAADGARSRWHVPDGWRVGEHRDARYTFDSVDGPVEVRLNGSPAACTVTVGGRPMEDGWVRTTRRSADGGVREVRAGIGALEWTVPCTVEETSPRQVWLSHEGDWALTEHVPARKGLTGTAVPTLTSPMPGAVVALAVADGDRVTAGQAVVAVEAMKMEHQVTAGVDGVVRLEVRVGDQVTRGQVLATIEPDTTPDSTAGSPTQEDA